MTETPKPNLNMGLGPLAEVNGDKLLLRGWRGISLINAGAILIPAALGVGAFVIGEWWRLAAAPLFAFSAYGCWAIYRGAICKIETFEDFTLIDGNRFENSGIDKFDGRRVSAPSGMDEVESGVELWVLTTDGREIPIIQMSGAVRIESIAAYLNTKLSKCDIT